MHTHAHTLKHTHTWLHIPKPLNTHFTFAPILLPLQRFTQKWIFNITSNGCTVNKYIAYILYKEAVQSLKYTNEESITETPSKLLLTAKSKWPKALSTWCMCHDKWMPIWHIILKIIGIKFIISDHICIIFVF